GATPVARALQLKLLLLAATAALGVHARLRLIPNLDAESLPKLGWHIAAITLVGLCFVAVGQSFRFGGAF
ncbi:copper transporter, partial [Pseudomonas aeruginosa]|nr:copper transporter [Pseudomonas aeruginosa]